MCPAAVVPCEHAAHGCSWTGSRSALQDTHTPHCPYAALQGFFRISDARTAALETENVLLRARLDAADGMLAVMRHELQAIKGALGPWSPDADSSPPSPYTQALSPPQPPAAAAHHLPFSPPTSSTVPPYPWRGHHDPPADVMAHLPPHPPTTALSEDPSIAPAASHEPRATGIAPADLAAYFPPPASDASLNSPPSPTTTTTTSSTSSGGTGRSLSATLTALRSALQTHDARARMSANAHAAELGAIRQVVAGLRMQLHAVLMELSNVSSNGHVTGADGWTPKLPAAARFFLPGLVPPPPPPAVSITKL